MNTEDKIIFCGQLILGSIPDNWLHNMHMLCHEYMDMKPIQEGYHTPFTTFLLYVINKTGIGNNIIWAGNLVKQIPDFVTTYPSMQEEAKSITKLDVLNMQAEMEAFDSIENCIIKPRLAISNLYRYVVAQDLSMELLLTPEDTAKAIKQLRENPYFYFEYLDYKHLMPTTWEEL